MMQVDFLSNLILTTATATTATTAATTSALTAGLNAATVAAASSVASQASISAINNQGRLGKVAKDITSKEALKNTAIAAVGAGIAGGALAAINPAPVTSNTSLATNLKTSFTEVATQTVASTAAQSAINGDSLSEALKNQGKNVLIYTVAKVGANQIGAAYHPADGSAGIGKPLQLTLHAGLGAATAAASGNDAVSGAIAGVAGELAGESLKSSVTNGSMTRDEASRLAGLISGASSVTYGGLTGQSDQEIADNAWEGSRIGGNAARENALRFKGTTIFPYPKKDYDLNVGVQYSTGPITVSHGTDGTGASANAIPSLSVGGYINAVPSGESSEVGLSYGIKDRFTADFITTNKGNFGFGFTGGFSIAPPVLVNSSVNLKLDD